MKHDNAECECGRVPMKTKMMNIFSNVYGDNEGVRVFFAPGRVNLIGEHTDYNGGHVFPCALTLGTYGAIRKRDDKLIHLYSENVSSGLIVERELGDYTIYKKGAWSNYPYGIFWALDKYGINIDCGFDIAFYGDIPPGSGLSSSASIEVLTAYMLREMLGFEKSFSDIALLCQYSENNYNGMNCGIMDQFASANGKEGHAIFLDTAALSYEYAPLELKGKTILIINTNVKHSLGSSKYNERRTESETALADLQKVLDIKTLGDIDEETFDANCAVIKDDVCRRRAKHAVYENRRTIKAYNALCKNDIKTFGELMKQSHISLRDDYEVTCRELDILFEEGQKLDGVWGIRMTGGGFGGCLVSIIDSDKEKDITRALKRIYRERCNMEASFYTVLAGSGPCELKK